MAMSTVQEIEAALSKLSRAEIEEVRAWIDDFLEDQFELTDEVKAKLDQSRDEIAKGRYATRQPARRIFLARSSSYEFNLRAHETKSIRPRWRGH